MRCWFIDRVLGQVPGLLLIWPLEQLHHTAKRLEISLHTKAKGGCIEVNGNFEIYGQSTRTREKDKKALKKTPDV